MRYIIIDVCVCVCVCVCVLCVCVVCVCVCCACVRPSFVCSNIVARITVFLISFVILRK